MLELRARLIEETRIQSPLALMASITAGFLTDSQRAALDAALAAKQQANKVVGGHHFTTPAHAGDKKPKNIKGSGSAKKGGGGGKFTWGNLLDEEGLAALDENDPNYDSEEDRAVVYQSKQASWVRQEVEAYKQEICTIVEEYFSSGDVANVADSLEELGAPSTMAHYFVKKLVMLALDRKDREREMASVLLSSLYAEVISPEQMQKGFARLVDALPDVLLDVPDAVELLSLFIARAVVDDILPPSAITKWCPASSPTAAASASATAAAEGAKRPAAGASAGELLAQLRGRVEMHLAARHAAEKILRCWGTGAGTSHAGAKEQVAALLVEFMDSHDAGEASRCLRSMNMPFFHHELVKQALHAGMNNNVQLQHLIGLLKRMTESNEVSANQLLKGFQRVADNLPDTALDNPAALELFDKVLAAAVSAGLIDQSTATSFTPPAPGTAAAERPASSASMASANGSGAAAGAAAAAASNGVGGASVPAFKAACAVALKEYFDSADAQEVAARLLEAGQPGLHPLFVKQAITMSMDRKDRERELVSSLLSELHPAVITDDQMSSGFKRLLSVADDLVLDIPDAMHLLSLFLGRAIVDEVLPPAFLASALPSLPDGGLGVAVVQATGNMLSARHAAERLQNCWHGGGLSLGELRGQMKAALEEYMSSSTVAEVAQVLADLDVPHYHHELVKDAVELGFEHPDKMDKVAALLAHLSNSGVITTTQMAMGLERVKSGLAEDALDAPTAPAAFEKLVKQGQTEGWLPADLAKMD